MRGPEGMQYLVLCFTEPPSAQGILPGHQRSELLNVRDVAYYGLNSNTEVLILNVVVFGDRILG